MPGTFVVVLRLPTLPTGVNVTLHQAPQWDQEVECTYNQEQQQWEAELPLADQPADVTFKFLCNGQWQPGDNLVIAAENLKPDGRIIFDTRSVSFDNQERLTVDVPAPARRFFDSSAPPTEEFDTIVVGSGAGGGTLAYLLSGQLNPDGTRRRVLVLDAGSYLFPTHVGNLPRRDTTGPGPAGAMWDLWYDYRTLRWSGRPEGPAAAVAQGLNFGGRTLFWGALAPRAKPWELAAWPTAVSTRIRNRWYDRAEQFMRVRQLTPSAYQSMVKDALRNMKELENYSHIDAPTATEYTGRSPNIVPTGVFSTAELLLGRKLQRDRDGQPAYPNLEIQPNQEVTRVELAQGANESTTAVAVHAQDHRTGQPRRYAVAAGGTVVLAAGTLGSPMIAEASGLTPGLPLIGKGLTDHPIYVVGFSVPRSSRWFSDTDSAMILSRGSSDQGQRPERPFNVKLSLNVRLAQSRFVESEDFFRLSDADRIACEIVFLAESALVDQNSVKSDPIGSNQPVITMDAQQVDVALQKAMDDYADAVLNKFDALPDSITRSYAPLGGVAHEVGTMRMGDPGASPGQQAVVDESLRVIGTTNLHVCDLSVFPSSPAANPTLTLVALAFGLAEHLDQTAAH